MTHYGTWREASHAYLDWKIGAVNTVVLLFRASRSSWRSANQLARKWRAFVYLGITNLCAIFFLVAKIALEYLPKLQDKKFRRELLVLQPARHARPPVHERVLDLDRHPRRARSDRRARDLLGHVLDGSRAVRPEELHVRREHRPLLAHRRRHLDFPVPDALPRLTPRSDTTPPARFAETDPWHDHDHQTENED